jgi:hypothetical protein
MRTVLVEVSGEVDVADVLSLEVSPEIRGCGEGVHKFEARQQAL